MKRIFIILMMLIIPMLQVSAQYDILERQYTKYLKVQKHKFKKKRSISWKRYERHSNRYSKSIAKWSRYYGLDSNIVKAVISWESNWSARASYKGCNGLMQVQGGSFIPDKNIRQGCSILAKNLKRFGNYEHALMGYNLGAAKAARYIRHGRAWRYSERVLDIAYVMALDSYYNNLAQQRKFIPNEHYAIQDNNSHCSPECHYRLSARMVQQTC